MQQTQAWEKLHDIEYCRRLSMGEFHQLLLDAGYATDKAQQLASQRGWSRLSAGMTL